MGERRQNEGEKREKKGSRVKVGEKKNGRERKAVDIQATKKFICVCV